MANVLSKDKQIQVIAALAEGCSMRALTRMTGIHRSAIARVALNVGQGCARILDEKMRDLTCNYLQFDEIWGFIGKKEKHISFDDDPTLGDVWTFCAIDSETKIVPAYRVGKRNHVTANAFVSDVASRIKNRPQISSDGLRSYIEAVENAFGSEVDYGMAIKQYGADSGEHHQERRYSAPEVTSIDRRVVAGRPEMDLISTSHVERLNGTTRNHVKRLARLICFQQEAGKLRGCGCASLRLLQFRENTQHAQDDSGNVCGNRKRLLVCGRSSRGCIVRIDREGR